MGRAKRDTLRDDVAQLFAEFGGQQNTLTIPRPYLTLVGDDHLMALLLSQCVYWSDRTSDPEGWFAKSYADWYIELGMTKRQCHRAATALKAYGLETKLRRSIYYGGTAVLHYRIQRGRFSACVREMLSRKVENDEDEKNDESAQPVVTKRHNQKCANVTTGSNESVQPYISETTAETTAETIKSAADAALTENDLHLDWLPADDPIFDTEPNPELYPCAGSDINAIISAWWEWVPLRPVRRGKVVEAKSHYANAQNRAYAENLIRRGITAADMAAFLADVRVNPQSTYAHLNEKAAPFAYIAPALEQWVAAGRTRQTFAPDRPRITPKRPGIVIELNLNDPESLEQLYRHPDLYVDIPRAYISPHEAERGMDASKSSNADSDTLNLTLIEGIPL